MKMLISMIAAKLNLKNTSNQAKLKKKRTSIERAYGEPLESCRTNEDIDAWLLKADPYMAELLED